VFLSGCSPGCNPPSLPACDFGLEPAKQVSAPQADEFITPYCPMDRYGIEELSLIAAPFAPEASPEEIAAFLTENVNKPNYDKIAANITNGFTPQNSISGYEAFFYARQILLDGETQAESFESQINRALAGTYLGGDPYLGGISAMRSILFSQCHDGDTCSVLEIQDGACRYGEAETTVRVSGIDAPEVGYYPIGGTSGWVNSKLVENVDKLYNEWIKKGNLPASVIKDIKKLIGLRVNYTGQLAGLIRNDLNTWNLSGGVARFMRESSIQWYWDGKGEKTPIALCGTWQPFDAFGRRLGSFYQILPSYLESYIKLRLSELMATKGFEKYKEYLKKAKPLIDVLKGVENEPVRNFLNMFEEGEENPRLLYSQARCEKLAQEFAQFVSQHDSVYSRDDQLMQILTGSVYAYDKYRNQNGDVYEEAGDYARQHGFGLWKEATFKTLYNINEADPRYHPPHCP
jgi:hypothetical protein